MNKQIAISDVVIIFQGHIPVKFVHVVNIEPDAKKGWWKVTFMDVGMPAMMWTWLLDNDQIEGQEFTMGGIPHRVQLYSRASAIPEVKTAVKKEVSAISEGEDLI